MQTLSRHTMKTEAPQEGREQCFKQTALFELNKKMCPHPQTQVFKHLVLLLAALFRKVVYPSWRRHITAAGFESSQPCPHLSLLSWFCVYDLRCGLSASCSCYNACHSLPPHATMMDSYTFGTVNPSKLLAFLSQLQKRNQGKDCVL